MRHPRAQILARALFVNVERHLLLRQGPQFDGAKFSVGPVGMALDLASLGFGSKHHDDPHVLIPHDGPEILCNHIRDQQLRLNPQKAPHQRGRGVSC